MDGSIIKTPVGVDLVQRAGLSDKRPELKLECMKWR